MSNRTTAGVEARQSMMRVWLAISAVWVAFWLLIATIVLLLGERSPFAHELSGFSLILLVPPLALLMLGTIGRWTFETAQRITVERPRRDF
jgi:hypothetical protein